MMINIRGSVFRRGSNITMYLIKLQWQKLDCETRFCCFVRYEWSPVRWNGTFLIFSGQIIAPNTEQQNLSINISLQSVNQPEAQQLSLEIWWKNKIYVVCEMTCQAFFNSFYLKTILSHLGYFVSSCHFVCLQTEIARWGMQSLVVERTKSGQVPQTCTHDRWLLQP